MHGMNFKVSQLGWSGGTDSNRRPSAPKADALPDCAIPRQPKKETIIRMCQLKVNVINQYIRNSLESLG